MNAIIIYSSKYGSTAECANYINSGLSGSVTLTDINKTNSNDISLENYDTIILGSSIYVGKISKKMQALCKENIDLILKKKVGIFLCCAFSEQVKEYLASNFPSALLKSAVVVKAFGGEARIDKMKLFDKLIMKAALKGNQNRLTISHETMNSFINELNRS